MNFQKTILFSNTDNRIKNNCNLSFLIKYSFVLFLSASIISCSNRSNDPKEEERPNILLLVADDLGYADLGCYGSDIETPNIDNLAMNGIRFSRFHTAPLCSPSRAMLLSGNDNHIAGIGGQYLVTDKFGYEGKLTNRVATIPQILQDVGYHTYIVGKWHLGNDSASNPFNKGFEHSFVNIRGSGNHYNNQGFFEHTPITPFTENGKTVKWNDGDYSTDFYTDKLIEYIDGNIRDNNPFFAFAAYTSPHWPLQVDEKFWRKYEGRYDAGYEELKERRLESLKEARMIPENTVLPPNHKRVIPWDSLSEKEKKKESRKMELYAGMVDNLDYNIGRLIQHLKDIGEYENTVIIFMSDNGAAAEDFYYHDIYGSFLQQHFTDDYESMGKPNSFISYGPQWAEAGSAPFRYFKGFTTEGGMIAPMIITGPFIERKNDIYHGLVTIMDIAPTIYEVTNAKYPKIFKNNEVYPLKGSSLIPLTMDKVSEVHSSEYVFGMEHKNRAMIRKGNWKITNIREPFLLENFELYDLSKDLGELNDLKNLEPTIYTDLMQEWMKFSNEIKVQVPTPQ